MLALLSRENCASRFVLHCWPVQITFESGFLRRTLRSAMPSMYSSKPADNPGHAAILIIPNALGCGPQLVGTRELRIGIFRFFGPCFAFADSFPCGDLMAAV